jgi:selenide,water dikinase
MATTTQLNRVGTDLAKDAAVHAMTDITGFGLLGHALEMARGTGKTIRIAASKLPFLKDAAALVQSGFVTGASGRNWKSYDTSITLPADTSEWRRQLLCDPQTSGRLLVACACDRADTLLETIIAAGYPAAPPKAPGHGEPRVVIEE